MKNRINIIIVLSIIVLIIAVGFSVKYFQQKQNGALPSSFTLEAFSEGSSSSGAVRQYSGELIFSNDTLIEGTEYYYSTSPTNDPKQYIPVKHLKCIIENQQWVAKNSGGECEIIDFLTLTKEGIEKQIDKKEIVQSEDFSFSNCHYRTCFRIIKNKRNQVSNILPVGFISAKNDWPPKIEILATDYSCRERPDPGDGINGAIVEKIINGRKYCITSFIDAAAGSRFGQYTYTTPYKDGVKTTNFSFQWSSCGGYGGPGDTNYDMCSDAVSNFIDKLDLIIDNLMQ